jgi:hypothetical protein
VPKSHPCPARLLLFCLVLLEQFRTDRVFWKQFEIAEKIVKLRDTSVLEQLKLYLKDNDRHVRGNAAYVFAALGDDEGVEVIKAILTDRSERSEGQGIPGGNWTSARKFPQIVTMQSICLAI